MFTGPDPAPAADDDDGTPYDDPVVRTRMAWLRTLLIIGLVGLLLWRVAYVEGQEWWSLAWIVPSAVIAVIGIVRMRSLSRDGAGERHLATLAWACGGFVALAAAGAILVAA